MSHSNLSSRFRMFAGPNGSGKSVLFDHLKKKKIIHTEIYVGPDRIESTFKKYKEFSFNAYRVKVDADEFIRESMSSGFVKAKKIDPKLIQKLKIRSGILKLNEDHLKSRNSAYVASLISMYLTLKLFETDQSFCLETVMSHKGKPDLFKTANEFGYQSYLYFVFTDNVEINIERVKHRVSEGGHNVSEEKIRSRYGECFKNLKKAINLADKSYLIDNTISFEIVLFRDQINGEEVVQTPYPKWLRQHYQPKCK